MSKNDKQRALVPRLRFPEFRENGNWHPYVFADVVQRVKTSISVEDIALENYVSTQNLLPDFGGVGPAGNLPPVSAVTKFKPGDTLFANIRPYLKKAWFATRSGGASNDVFVFRSRGQVDPRFMTQRIQSDAFVTYVMAAAKGVKMPRGDLSHIEQFPLPLPRDTVEQHKIANCLGSLDDLIAAEGRKLAALREHKKGLVQQLFPRAGETRPRLRFPEFQGAPEWKERKLSRYVDLVSGVHLSPDEYGETGNLPYFTGPSDFTDKIDDVTKWTEATGNIASAGDILITVKGSGVGELWYLQLERVAMGRQLMAVKPKNGVVQFIFQLLLVKRRRFEVLASGNLIPGLSRGDILDLIIPFPEEGEQWRVAACLSSLDALITAQAEKLESLRTHKRGLMQQLFPSPAGAGA